MLFYINNFLFRDIDKKEDNGGFSLIESIVSLLIFVITFSLAAPLFVAQQKSNINNEIRTGAVSLSQQVLDNLRLETSLTLGETNESSISSLGKEYSYNQFVCSDKPSFNADSSVSCNTTVDLSNPMRYILLQVEYNEETIYTVETIYTDIQ
ncbi:hypothetical protein Lepto7376_2290 [[Leptolyngbya] sp. PCC 7376]|uniref:type IV pilus modification PilV family protein n=1 Tax=[Leptolyngbya] sp. PCC 7376 TaxID=111781 RepID=UPI00029EDEFC|nr:type II secretion system protein [[Leptolyngbya] sp. PCC 7376]AFY38580.1 hypothetical protein Lepto7376_2290 [[Leptolyngbya] sp. PCC 7376]